MRLPHPPALGVVVVVAVLDVGRDPDFSDPDYNPRPVCVPIRIIEMAFLGLGP